MKVVVNSYPFARTDRQRDQELLEHAPQEEAPPHGDRPCDAPSQDRPRHPIQPPQPPGRCKPRQPGFCRSVMGHQCPPPAGQRSATSQGPGHAEPHPPHVSQYFSYNRRYESVELLLHVTHQQQPVRRSPPAEPPTGGRPQRLALARSGLDHYAAVESAQLSKCTSFQ